MVEVVELSDGICERLGLELELLAHRPRVFRVRGLIPRSAGVVPLDNSFHVVEDMLHVQARWLVARDPVDTLVEDDEEGFEFVRNLVYLARICELCCRHELPHTLKNRVQQRFKLVESGVGAQALTVRRVCRAPVSFLERAESRLIARPQLCASIAFLGLRSL